MYSYFIIYIYIYKTAPAKLTADFRVIIRKNRDHPVTAPLIETRTPAPFFRYGHTL